MNHAKINFKRLVATVLTLFLLQTMILPAFAATPETDEFCFKVVEMLEENDGLTIKLDYDNRTGSRLSFGWVGSCSIVVETDQGTFSTVVHRAEDVNIGNGSCTFFVPSCVGTAKTITLTEVTQLNDNGLPGAEMSDVVIYENGETGQVYEFSFFAKYKMFLPFAIIFIIAICIISVVVTMVHKQHKKAAEAFRAFSNPRPDDSVPQDNGFGPPAGMEDAVAQPAQQEHNDDIGGFTPPPQM